MTRIVLTILAAAWTLVPNIGYASCAGSDAFVNGITLYKTITLTLPAAIKNDLTDAYCNASPKFRRDIDRIDFIFLSAEGCGNFDLNLCDRATANPARLSWGMRSEGGYTEMGISGLLWPTTGTAAKPAITLDVYETTILNTLLPIAAPPLPTFPPGATAPLTSSWLTVLAALAHELGHVRWFTVNARGGYGRPFDFARLHKCNFFGKDRNGELWGWRDRGKRALSPKGRWRDFAAKTNEIPNDHILPPRFMDFDATDKYTPLNALFAQEQPWASYLGANAPDEDFVETYKFSVLYDAGLASMQLTIPNPAGGNWTRDIYADVKSGAKKLLAQKADCLRKIP
jgi:hypothetical protein